MILEAMAVKCYVEGIYVDNFFEYFQWLNSTAYAL